MQRNLQMIAVMALLGCMLTGSTAWAMFPEDVRQALRVMVREAVQPSLSKSGLPADKTISILPISGDQDRVLMGLLKHAIQDAGLKCVEGKNDPFWNDVLAEVEWDERKADILDTQTLVTFGKLKATQFLMYGFVREATTSGQRVFVEIELHVSSIETKAHIWGDVFAQRIYKDNAIRGIVEIDESVRRVLAETFEKGRASLTDAAGQLGEIDTAALVPLAGDVDGYVTSRVEALLSRSTVTPKNLNVSTLGEAEALLRDNPSRADAIVHGSVRDLSRERKNRHYLRDGNFMVIDHEVRAEVQLKLQESETGAIPWSTTLTAMTIDPVEITWSDLIYEHPKEAIKLALGTVGVIVLLIVIGMFLRSTRRVR